MALFYIQKILTCNFLGKNPWKW